MSYHGSALLWLVELIRLPKELSFKRSGERLHRAYVKAQKIRGRLPSGNLERR